MGAVMVGTTRAARSVWLFIFVVVLSGATTTDEFPTVFGDEMDHLVGHWRCADENASMRLLTTREYWPNGESRMSYRLTTLDGTDSHLSMIGRGHWSLRGDILREAVTELFVAKLDIDGTDMRDTDAEAALLQELKHEQVESRLLSLSNKRLVLAPMDASSTLVCARIR